MRVDARGTRHPRPLEMLREHMRDNCRRDIDVELLLDSSEYARTVSSFARMSKCQASIEKADGYYILRINGQMCSCA